MTTTLTRKLINALEPEQWTERRELPHLFPTVDFPRLQKELHNLVQRGVLELKQSDAVFCYRIRKQNPSQEPSSQELIDNVLEFRAANGLLREGDHNRMRVALQKAELDAAKQNIELEEQGEEIASRKDLPDLDFDQFRKLMGLDND
jgi:hypothetical protein